MGTIHKAHLTTTHQAPPWRSQEVSHTIQVYLPPGTTLDPPPQSPLTPALPGIHPARPLKAARPSVRHVAPSRAPAGVGQQTRGAGGCSRVGDVESVAGGRGALWGGRGLYHVRQDPDPEGRGSQGPRG